MIEERLLERGTSAWRAVSPHLPPALANAIRARARVPLTRGLATSVGGAGPVLVRRPDGAVVLVDGGRRRRVQSTLVSATLESLLGAPRRVPAPELDGLPEGPPVEVLATQSSRPFIVVGGTRLPLRGLPGPRLVDVGELERYPEGPELNVAEANMPRNRMANRGTGLLADRPGVPRAVTRGARRMVRRVRGIPGRN